MRPKWMRASKWILLRLKSVCVLLVEEALELLGTYVFVRTLQNIFSILMLILLIMIPKLVLCMRILFQIWILMKSFMREIITIESVAKPWSSSSSIFMEKYAMLLRSFSLVKVKERLSMILVELLKMKRHLKEEEGGFCGSENIYKLHHFVTVV